MEQNDMRRSYSFILWTFLIILSFLLFANTSDIQQKKTATFQLQYRELGEVTGKVKSLLSSEGSILIKPQNRQIVIDDFVENIEAIAQLIKQLDIPLKEVNLDIYFIHASKGSGKKKVSDELQEMAAKLSGFLSYDYYQLIDKHRVKVKEGDTTTLQLGEIYIVNFYIQIPPGTDGVIKLKNFRLFKKEKLANGRYRLRKLLVTAINLINGSPSIIGASSSEESNEALIMALTAFVEE